MVQSLTSRMGTGGGNVPLVMEQSAVVYALDRACYNQGINAQYEPQISDNGICHTLVAKLPSAICAYPEYIVRRLTPLECCRLQGFPDYWCDDLGTENPTEEDVAFWREVFETHSQITKGKLSNKTDKQIIKWLQNPHSDTAEYKMWGNGIALPNALYVMQGIAEVLRSGGNG